MSADSGTCRSGLLAGLLIALFAGWAAAGQAEHVLTEEELTLIHSMAPEVEALVARTKPASWQARHACLYYSLAGRYLLAQQGIATELVTGAVIYAPRTPRRHSIRPHAWLETGSHLIDFATLPRTGDITVIPLERVARRGSGVIPGTTQVLARAGPRDPDHLRYLADHCDRFARNTGERR